MKYREFWICENETKDKNKDVFLLARENPIEMLGVDKIKVIEHQAYTDLKQHADMLYEALKFYADMATNKNHELIFDDENSSRAEVYERYQQYSIGELGVKALEATKTYESFLKEGEK